MGDVFSRASGMGLYILDEKGQPVQARSLEEWARFFESEARILCLNRLFVGSDEGEIEVTVSTIFLGFPGPYSLRNGPGSPLWETLIKGGPWDGYQERYTSRGEALHGHVKAMERAVSPRPEPEPEATPGNE
jgi:hypothetical protein